MLPTDCLLKVPWARRIYDNDNGEQLQRYATLLMQLPVRTLCSSLAAYD